jgi:nickel transport protein
LLAGAGTAQAHRLDAQVFLLPDRKVQVESWYSTGEAARGAVVQVLRADRSLLLEGKLDDRGIFVFEVPAPETLTIVVSAGMGHRKELTIAGESFARMPSSDPQSSGPAASGPEPVPLADRSSAFPAKDVLLGIAFVLATAAFVMSLRNQRRLREMDSQPRNSFKT